MQRQPTAMNESVFCRVEDMLKQRGVNFEVLRHQPVFTRPRGGGHSWSSAVDRGKVLICKVDR